MAPPPSTPTTPPASDEQRRLQQELAPDVALAGAEGEPHADLARPLDHRHQHDVHDHDPAHARGRPRR